METLLKSISYQAYRRYFFRYQIIATVLVCLPVFLSCFIVIGIPHLFFMILIALMGDGYATVARRVLHGIMFLYYAGLLFLTLQLWPEFQGDWNHADTIDFLIQAQMMVLPVILSIQLPFIAFEWMYPTLAPHEILDQQHTIHH